MKRCFIGDLCSLGVQYRYHQTAQHQETSWKYCGYWQCLQTTFDMKCRLSFLLEWSIIQPQFFESRCDTFYIWLWYCLELYLLVWNHLLCRSDRHTFMSAFCNTLPVGCLKFYLSLEICSSVWPFTISFQGSKLNIICLVFYHCMEETKDKN